MFKAEIANFKQYWPVHLFIHVPWGFFSAFLMTQYDEWGLGALVSGRRLLVRQSGSGSGGSSPSGTTPWD